MSLFGKNGSDLFGTIGGVIKENHDTLFYRAAGGIFLYQLFEKGPLSIDPYFDFAVATSSREIVRGITWAVKSMKPTHQLVGDHSTPLDCAKFSSASKVGMMAGASLVCLDAALHIVVNGQNPVAAAVFSGVSILLPYAMLKTEHQHLPNGLKDVIDSYKAMWNYTDDDGKGGHTKRVINKIKSGFVKAAEWIGGCTPQPEMIPAYNPLRIPHKTNAL